MKFNLKSAISLIVVLAIAFAFCFIVVTRIDDEMGKAIVTTFLTITTSVVGFYIGYQTNKPTQVKDESEEEESE